MVKTVDLPVEEEDIVLLAHSPTQRPGADMALGAAPPYFNANNDASDAIAVNSASSSGTRIQPAQKSKTTPPSENKSNLTSGAVEVPGIKVDRNIEGNDGLRNHTTPTLVGEERGINEEDVEARLEVAETYKNYVVAEVVDDSKFFGVPKKVWLIASIVMLLVIVGVVVLATTLPPEKTAEKPDPPASLTSDQMPETLFHKLETSIIRTDADRIPFEEPISPQSLALEWLSTDPFSLSEGRPIAEILERYVLVVLYYSTNGPNWKLEGLPFREEIPACDWNNGLNYGLDEARGIYCSGNSTVEHVLLNSVGLTGTIPWELSLLDNLVELIVSGNAVRGTIPSDFSNLSNLQSIMLWSNSLSGSLPMRLPSSIENLDFSANSLSGTIPSEWGDHLPNVFYLSLFDNQLVGPIPSELGQLTALQNFQVGNNIFTGVLPSELGQLTALQDFQIYKNSFIGKLPTELGQLTALIYLYTFMNQFTGVLPSELGLLTNLVLFDTSNNAFTGTIPTELAQLQKLENFSFFDNHLTGSVDSLLCTSTNSINPNYTKQWILLEGDCLANDDGSVEIECSCCTFCCSAVFDDIEACNQLGSI